MNIEKGVFGKLFTKEKLELADVAESALQDVAMGFNDIINASNKQSARIGKLLTVVNKLKSDLSDAQSAKDDKKAKSIEQNINIINAVRKEAMNLLAQIDKLAQKGKGVY